MDNYRTYDITDKVKKVIGGKYETGEKKVPVDVAVLFDKKKHRNLRAGKMEKKRVWKRFLFYRKRKCGSEICGTDTGFRADNRTSILSEESVGRNGTERAGCGYLCRKTLGSDSETGTGIPLWGKLSFCIDGTDPEAGYIRVSEQI